MINPIQLFIDFWPSILPGGFQMYTPVHCSEAPQYGGYQQLPEQLGVEAAPTQGNP